MSPLLDSPLTESRHKTRTDTTRTPGALSGTDGSNPAPSSRESRKLACSPLIPGPGMQRGTFLLVTCRGTDLLLAVKGVEQGSMDFIRRDRQVFETLAAVSRQRGWR